MKLPAQRTVTADAIESPVEDVMRYAIAIGAVLVVLLPAARGFSQALGWLPLWLLAMPLTGWWALHRFRLPQRVSQARNETVRRRRPGPQARRRGRLTVRPALPRVA